MNGMDPSVSPVWISILLQEDSSAGKGQAVYFRENPIRDKSAAENVGLEGVLHAWIMHALAAHVSTAAVAGEGVT